YFEERFGRGFEYAYVIPGMTRVVQSAGRVIRSETDVGVIALVCRRFLQKPYRTFLPTHWYDEAPDELSSREPGEAVAAFFAGGALRTAAASDPARPRPAPTPDAGPPVPGRRRTPSRRPRRPRGLPGPSGDPG
ncbi:MAG TPA: helicase C-terminal domain-containing protein, partial [Thermoanaerobaculia bacterium]|nr:helicase C-terminal domain-containing protein [Thermoanaerobaculia bacterium]